MNIMWDFRLFSTKCAERGIGVYTRWCARELLRRNPGHTIYLWGDPAAIPPECSDGNCRIVAADAPGWKRSLWAIPLLARRKKIDLFHYWAAMTPLYQIGLGLRPGCPAIAAVYDLGVAFWSDIPYLAQARKRLFWRAQKRLVRSIDKIQCISGETAGQIRAFDRALASRVAIAYPPAPWASASKCRNERLPQFVALGGAPHKNLFSTFQAFGQFREWRPDYSLIVCGETTEEEKEAALGFEGVIFDTMDTYPAHLAHSAGLVFRSRHEGLGLPPIEAMRAGCPLILSDIPSLREIAQHAAMFVAPDSVDECVAAMKEIAAHTRQWAARSLRGYERYQQLAATTQDFFDHYFSPEEDAA
jgi:glycosyltransferase involved in cell wall biosynthesis